MANRTAVLVLILAMLMALSSTVLAGDGTVGVECSPSRGNSWGSC